MSFQIRTASRKKAKLRIGISGPSGSGKTYSALLLARGLTDSWEKIVLIDTENGSGDLYSNMGEYSVLTLDAPFTPERYIEAIRSCEDSGADVVIIDSTSHEWEGKGGCLEANEAIAQARFKGNTWSAWSQTTPRHQKFIEAITTSKCHIITTARSKTETINVDGKIKKAGTKDIQREGFEYEFTIMFNIDRDKHNATASKDRTELFIDRDPFVISEKTGKELIKWNESGADPVNKDAEYQATFDRLAIAIRNAPTMDELKALFVESLKSDITDEQRDMLVQCKDHRKAEFEADKWFDTPTDPT